MFFRSYFVSPCSVWTNRAWMFRIWPRLRILQVGEGQDPVPVPYRHGVSPVSSGKCNVYKPAVLGEEVAARTTACQLPYCFPIISKMRFQRLSKSLNSTSQLSLCLPCCCGRHATFGAAYLGKMNKLPTSGREKPADLFCDFWNDRFVFHSIARWPCKQGPVMPKSLPRSQSCTLQPRLFCHPNHGCDWRRFGSFKLAQCFQIATEGGEKLHQDLLRNFILILRSPLQVLMCSGAITGMGFVALGFGAESPSSDRLILRVSQTKSWQFH